MYFFFIVTYYLGKWERNDNPLIEHIRWSGQFCPFIKNHSTTKNIPLNIQQLSSQLSAPFYREILMPTNLNIEAERLRTFDNWNIQFIDKNILAETGFYFVGLCDIVRCYFCHIEVARFNPNDDILDLHNKYSRRCPLIFDPRLTNNVAIDEVHLLHTLRIEQFWDDPAAYTQRMISAVNAENGIFTTSTIRMPETLPPYSEANSSSSATFTFRPAPPPSPTTTTTTTANPSPVPSSPTPSEVSTSSSSSESPEIVEFHRTLRLFEDADETRRNRNDTRWTFQEVSENEAGPSRPVRPARPLTNIYEEVYATNIEDSEDDDSDEENIDVVSVGKENVPNNANDSDAILCKICVEEKINTAVIPCAHAFCIKCAKKIKACPICRASISSTMKIFIP